MEFSHIPNVRLTVQPSNERRRKKYKQAQLPVGEGLSNVLLVLEHFGHLDEKAEDFLEEIFKAPTDEDGHSNATEFLGYWRNLFRLCIAMISTFESI